MHITDEVNTGVLEKVAHKNFANLAGKNLCWTLFLIKFIKRDSDTGVLQLNF